MVKILIFKTQRCRTAAIFRIGTSPFPCLRNGLFSYSKLSGRDLSLCSRVYVDINLECVFKVSAMHCGGFVNNRERFCVVFGSHQHCARAKHFLSFLPVYETSHRGSFITQSICMSNEHQGGCVHGVSESDQFGSNRRRRHRSQSTCTAAARRH